MRFREDLFLDGGSSTTDRSNFSKIDDVRLGELTANDAVVADGSAQFEWNETERRTNNGLLNTWNSDNPTLDVDCETPLTVSMIEDELRDGKLNVVALPLLFKAVN